MQILIKVAARYGFLGGLIVAIYVYLLDFTNLVYKSRMGGLFGYLAIIIMPIATYLALRALKKYNSGTRLKFIHALSAGLLVSLTAAIAYSILSYFYTDLLMTDYPGKMAALEQVQMEKQGKSPEEIRLAIAKIRAHYSSFKPYANTLIYFLVLGLIYTLLSYIIIYFQQKNHEKVN